MVKANAISPTTSQTPVHKTCEVGETRAQSENESVNPNFAASEGVDGDDIDLGLNELAGHLESLNTEAELLAPASPIADPVSSYLNNIFPSSQLYTGPNSSIDADVAAFITATINERASQTARHERPFDNEQQWACQDSTVRQLFMEFQQRFITTVEQLDLTKAQKLELKLEAKYLVSPGGSFKDPIMFLLNYPTFNCASPCYGSTLDLDNKSIRALSRALNGLAG